VTRRALALAALAAISTPLGAQATAGASSPDSLAAEIVRRFESGTPESFDSIIVDPARQVVRDAAPRKRPRKGGLARVLWRDPSSAVLLVSGTLAIGSPADGTNAARRFSGLYEARESGGRWTVARQIPLDEKNRIRSQTIEATLAPGRRIDLADTLEIGVGGPYGFVARLNPSIELAEVSIDGKPAEHALGGGILWVAAPAKARSRLVLRYGMPLAKDQQSAESDSIGPIYGGVGNDQAWLPFFDYDAAGDHGAFRVTVHAPAAYPITTTLPQTERVANGVRTVRGVSQEGTFVTSIFYDRGWKPASGTVDGIRWETFLTPDFDVPTDTIVAVLRRTNRILASHFGEPQTRYIGFAEQRTIPYGFRYRANSVVMAGKGGGKFVDSGIAPRANLAHEIAHGWTDPAGEGANFLREGWATLAESYVLRAEYGPEVERAFWEIRRNGFTAAQAGRLGILANPDNGGVHYSKGAWVLRMMRDRLGEATFDRGMRAFMHEASNGSAGYREFVAQLSRAAGRDVAPWIMPWLTEKAAPDLDARIDGSRVIVEQSGPIFDLALDVELTTSRGPVRRAMHVSHRADTLDVASLGAVSAVRIDPDGKLLLKRHMGDVVRFELRADSAKQVALAGDFMARPIPATKQGDVWVVEIPMVEGRYYYSWVVDGKNGEGKGGELEGVREVKPVKRVENAYPKLY
jgi:hypothetical protein